MGMGNDSNRRAKGITSNFGIGILTTATCTYALGSHRSLEVKKKVRLYVFVEWVELRLSLTETST